MPTATCNACNVVFVDDEQKRIHYRSEWHRYNLKRKVAGVPGVTEALFLAWEAALSEGTTPTLYGCTPCGKEYTSSRAHEQHLSSRSHLMRAASQSQEPSRSSTAGGITPLPVRTTTTVEEDEDEELPDESTSNSMQATNAADSSRRDEEIEELELDPSCCFMCDLKHGTVDECMVHLHRKHGFFVPDSEYLKDPGGLLAYVGLKVKRDFICLYCDDRRRAFQSLEAVRKHMHAKGHCKVRFGDGGDDEDADLEDFYDYSSRYADVDGKQLVAAADGNCGIELGIGGSELVITNKSGKGTRVRSLGSREFIRYYRQKPRPSSTTRRALALSMPSRYKSVGLVTVSSELQTVRMKM
ncbi:cytoplasmic 60S subunit biogenesis factor REI1 homolog 1-like isoform X1 [Miscanthus floridulus]|uniref:cytoplasmic 60S subunit biogenesis factor REI1 homolog 1-like isoform X1 n=1 Tax=Miscanthus floridulus TaxID=154761 RepID=UPI003458C9A9